MVQSHQPFACGGGRGEITIWRARRVKDGALSHQNQRESTGSRVPIRKVSREVVNPDSRAPIAKPLLQQSNTFKQLGTLDLGGLVGR